MPIPCLPTETSIEVRCPVCGCGFMLLSEPTLLPHRGALRRAARRSLAGQHHAAGSPGSHVHPSEVFDLPGWDGEPERGSSSGQWNLGHTFQGAN